MYRFGNSAFVYGYLLGNRIVTFLNAYWWIYTDVGCSMPRRCQSRLPNSRFQRRRKNTLQNNQCRQQKKSHPMIHQSNRPIQHLDLAPQVTAPPCRQTLIHRHGQGLVRVPMDIIHGHRVRIRLVRQGLPELAVESAPGGPAQLHD